MPEFVKQPSMSTDPVPSASKSPSQSPSQSPAQASMQLAVELSTVELSLQLSSQPPELPLAPSAVAIEELSTPPRPTRPTRASNRSTPCCQCCSELDMIDACCITIDRSVEALNTCGDCFVTSVVHLCLICCSQRVMMTGTQPRHLTVQDLREQDLDNRLDTCCCGVCRIPRWWCAYCCCICHESEDGLVRPYRCTSKLRQCFQRVAVVMCIFGIAALVYMAFVGVVTVGLWATCTAGQCALG